MNKTTITKVLKKIESDNENYSIGFKRLMALPAKTRKGMGAKAIYDGVEINEVTAKCKAFLESLTESEFKNWMVVN